VFVKKLDLASLKSIRDFANDINRTETKLNVLVHNAGTAHMFGPKTTEDGLELTMATNHFGPFLLTHLLIGESYTCNAHSCSLTGNNRATEADL